ncbi:kelch repeat-containing protein [Wukongibacter sp. M2B1]|uniref:kelch repeat-containing protein n=1 Tax=Wukongibacter sp. M2B1 TaxID=3088895 RepID=UPI003D791127
MANWTAYALTDSLKIKKDYEKIVDRSEAEIRGDIIYKIENNLYYFQQTVQGATNNIIFKLDLNTNILTRVSHDFGTNSIMYLYSDNKEYLYVAIYRNTWELHRYKDGVGWTQLHVTDKTSANGFKEKGIIYNNAIYTFGYTNRGQPTGNTNIRKYDIDTQQFTEMKPLPKSICRMGALLIDDKIYIVGGVNREDSVTVNSITYNSTYVYDITDNTITALANMNYARYALGLCKYKNYLYAVGGRYKEGYVETKPVIERYDINKNKWEIVEDSLFITRMHIESSIIDIVTSDNKTFYTISSHYALYKWYVEQKIDGLENLKRFLSI